MAAKQKEIDEIHYWTMIPLEVYCFINMEYRSKHSKWVYNFDKDEEDPAKWGKSPNPHYVRGIKPNKFPEGCKKKITIDCLKCPHVAYVEYTGEGEEEKE